MRNGEAELQAWAIGRRCSGGGEFARRLSSPAAAKQRDEKEKEHRWLALKRTRTTPRLKRNRSRLFTVAIPPHFFFYFFFSKLLTITYGNFKNLQHESCSKLKALQLSFLTNSKFQLVLKLDFQIWNFNLGFNK
jgi:hypothetical protein